MRTRDEIFCNKFFWEECRNNINLYYNLKIKSQCLTKVLEKYTNDKCPYLI